MRLISSVAFSLTVCMCATVLPEVSNADPLERLVTPLPGAESWWEPPGTEDNLPPLNASHFKLGYNHAMLDRIKHGETLEQLLAVRGPVWEFAHNDPRYFVLLRGELLDVEIQVANATQTNRLDGEREYLKLEGGYRVPLGGNDELAFALASTTMNLPISGQLPSLVEGLPGFMGDDPVRLDWRENGWEAATTYRSGHDSITLAYGETASTIALNVQGLDDTIRAAVKPRGQSYGVLVEYCLNLNLALEAYLREVHNKGEQGIFLNGESVGPLRCEQDSWRFGLALRQPGGNPGWRISFAQGLYDTTLVGSARLSGFGGPVFGIVAPRGHVEASSRIKLQTALAEWRGGEVAGGELKYLLGTTRFDVDAEASTWQSVLFGAARVNKSTTMLDLEAGWLAHLGLAIDWDTSPSSHIGLEISQSIPFQTSKVGPPEPPGTPGQPAKRAVDGGRNITLTYTVWL